MDGRTIPHPDELVPGTTYLRVQTVAGVDVRELVVFLRMELDKKSLAPQSVLWLWFRHSFGDCPCDWVPAVEYRELPPIAPSGNSG